MRTAHRHILMCLDLTMIDCDLPLPAPQEWQRGKTLPTILATVADYAGDLKKFIEPSFAKRCVELALEELVRAVAS